MGDCEFCIQFCIRAQHERLIKSVIDDAHDVVTSPCDVIDDVALWWVVVKPLVVLLVKLCDQVIDKSRGTP